MYSVLSAVAEVLYGILHIYFYVVLVSVLLKLVAADPHNPVVRLFSQLTEPVYRRIRGALPFVVTGRTDLSPAVAVALILALKRLVEELLRLAR